MKTFGIRPYQPEDFQGIYEAAVESREVVARWMDWLTPGYSPEDAKRWVGQAMESRELGTAYESVIFDLFDGSIVGSCGLNQLNRKDGVCNLGYWVRASRQREGAARQATLLLREFGFGSLGFNRLEILIADGNTASRRVAESVGAAYEGRLGMRLKLFGAAWDAHLYALLNPDATRMSPGSFPVN